MRYTTVLYIAQVCCNSNVNQESSSTYSITVAPSRTKSPLGVFMEPFSHRPTPVTDWLESTCRWWCHCRYSEMPFSLRVRWKLQYLLVQYLWEYSIAPRIVHVVTILFTLDLLTVLIQTWVQPVLQLSRIFRVDSREQIQATICSKSYIDRGRIIKSICLLFNIVVN